MTISEVCDLIRTGTNERLNQALAHSPELARQKTEQGISLLTFACYCRNAEAVKIIREHRPQLDEFEASCLGDIAAVTSGLSKYPERLNTFSADGFTMLGFACFFGHADLATFLVKKGANVNQAANNSFKVAPLHSACAISDYGITEMLLKHGANPNAQQQSGVTPLHEAAHHGKTELVRLLLQHGADVNAKTETGQTPLAMAEEKSFGETAELIRQHGGV